ncbi:Uncharacterised protein [Mycobacteroides abscessus subsp. abscessus]|nr:Uncharacterised protein [Mycobacteroides abscessus subsp. abscessus]
MCQPGAVVELHAAVEPVAGVDGPVATGLALRQGIPGRTTRDGRYLGTESRAGVSTLLDTGMRPVSRPLTDSTE